MVKLKDSASEINVEKWSYTSATTWRIEQRRRPVPAYSSRTIVPAIVTIETIYTLIALPSCDQVCIDFQRLL